MSERTDVSRQIAERAAAAAEAEQAAREAAEAARRQNTAQFVGPAACSAT